MRNQLVHTQPGVLGIPVWSLACLTVAPVVGQVLSEEHRCRADGRRWGHHGHVSAKGTCAFSRFCTLFFCSPPVFQGGTLVLMADNSAKNDYVMWSHMTHIHVDWFELANWKTHFDIPQLDQLIGAAISRYHQFNDCYDAAVAAPPAHIAAVLGRLSAGR